MATGDTRRFIGKRVIVTGGARGIGRAIARRFLAEGAAVLITDIRESDLAETAAALSAEAPDRVRTRVCDVGSRPAVDALARDVAQSFSPVHALINNAGTAQFHPFLDIPTEAWDEIIRVNLTGVFHMSQAIGRLMKEAGGGVIVNMASTNGLVGEENLAHYNASKGGVVLLTKTMAIDLAPYGIRTNAVCPGYILTPLSRSLTTPEERRTYIDAKVPLGREGTPEDVAGVFAFLASDDAAFMTGACVVVDGGQLTF